MSIELVELMYLKCDQITLAGSPCSETYPPNYRDGWITAQANEPGGRIEELVRRANLIGWVADTKYNGLKGISVASLCPTHGTSYHE